MLPHFKIRYPEINSENSWNFTKYPEILQNVQVFYINCIYMMLLIPEIFWFSKCAFSILENPKNSWKFLKFGRSGSTESDRDLTLTNTSAHQAFCAGSNSGHCSGLSSSNLNKHNSCRLARCLPWRGCVEEANGHLNCEFIIFYIHDVFILHGCAGWYHVCLNRYNLLRLRGELTTCKCAWVCRDLMGFVKNIVLGILFLKSL